MVAITCTCGQPQTFKFNKKPEEGSKDQNVHPILDKNGNPLEIKLGGGAYVFDASAGGTRKVVTTNVTDEECELLNKNDAYVRMKKRGFFVEHKIGDTPTDRDGTPADQQKHDNTAQILDSEHAKGDDPRLDHAATRAFAGENNVFRGQANAASVDGSDITISL